MVLSPWGSRGHWHAVAPVESMTNDAGPLGPASYPVGVLSLCCIGFGDVDGSVNCVCRLSFSFRGIHFLSRAVLKKKT